ncbi:MAG: hypothetical protein QW041_02770 [Candidatus Pacearchaeota archaeon]
MTSLNLSDLFTNLENSSEFIKFKKKHPKSYFCAAFFVFDYDNNEEKKQLDYYISKEEGIMTFILDQKIIPKKAEMIKKEELKEIKKDEIKIDLNKAIEIAKKEAEKQNFNLSKIIAILQRLKKSEKLIWNFTLLSGFNILRLHINMEGKFLLKQKSSMLDMIQIEKGNKNKNSYIG